MKGFVTMFGVGMGYLYIYSGILFHIMHLVLDSVVCAYLFSTKNFSQGLLGSGIWLMCYTLGLEA